MEAILWGLINDAISVGLTPGKTHLISLSMGVQLTLEQSFLFSLSPGSQQLTFKFLQKLICFHISQTQVLCSPSCSLKPHSFGLSLGGADHLPPPLFLGRGWPLGIHNTSTSPINKLSLRAPTASFILPSVGVLSQKLVWHSSQSDCNIILKHPIWIVDTCYSKPLRSPRQWEKMHLIVAFNPYLSTA